MNMQYLVYNNAKKCFIDDNILKCMKLKEYVTPENTPKISLIEKIDKFNQNADKLFYYLANPDEILKNAIVLIAKSSFKICVIGSMWLIIIYVISEDRKYLKKALATFGIYAGLQIIGGCIVGTLT